MSCLCYIEHLSNNNRQHHVAYVLRRRCFCDSEKEMKCLLSLSNVKIIIRKTIFVAVANKRVP